MTKAIGPTIPRWRLGEELARLRTEAGLTLADAAAELDCTEWKIRKIESGTVGVTKPDLRALLDLYGVKERDGLEELRARGRQRGWWTHRQVTAQQASFLGIESAASVIRSWEPLVVPGLLHTEGYIRALSTGWHIPAEAVELDMQIKLERQKRVWDAPSPEAWFVVDEAVLARNVGDAQVMHEQLARLLDPPAGTVVQVMPLDRGAHRGVAGSLVIFEFDELHSPIAYVASQVGGVYVENDVRSYQAAMDHVLAAALSPADSGDLIRAKMEQWRSGETTST